MSDRNTIPDFTADPASMEPALRAIKDIVEQLTGQRASRENTGLRGAPLIYVQGYEPRSGRDGVIRAGTLWINEDTDEAFYWSGTMWKPLLGDVLEVTAALAAESDQEAGEMAFFARNTAPTGWLKANGALVSRTTYERLFVRIGTSFGVGDGSTTFALPDLRGEFPRGWDDGRGVDSGRAFASFQAQDWKSFSIENRSAGYVHGAHMGKFLANHNNTNLFTGEWNAVNNLAASNNLWWDGSEIRPRNIALLACIKY